MSKQPKRTVTKFFFLSTLALALIIPTLFAGASTTSSSLSSSPTLKIEDTNPSVLLLQQYLNNNGYVVNEIKGEPGSIGNETTKFGLKTKQALIRFQKDHNITPADGIFGPITKAKTLEVATTLTGDTSGGAVLGVAMTSSMSGGTVPFYQTSSVTLNIKGQGSGSITSSPDGLACSGNNKVCQLTSPSLPQPTSFVFRATPNDNTTIFDNWAGDCPSTSINNLLRDMCTVSLIPGGHRNIEAYFKVGRQHTLTIVNDIPAGNQSSVITESNISQSGTSGGSSGNSYYEGSIVTLAPWLSGNVEFLGFTGDGLSSNGLSNAATTVTMDADKVITFHVRNKSQHTLTLLTNTGDGEGSITINGQPVTSNQTFSDGDVVTLTGTANVGSKVGSWFVNGMSVAATYAVGQSLVPDQTTSVDITMNQDINVGLPFNIARLSVSKGGTGSGNVTINPYTSAYGSSLPSGSVRVLTATANANSTFDGFIDPWGGYHDSPYTLTTGDMETAITAVFTAKATDPTPVTVIATTTPTTTPVVVVASSTSSTSSTTPVITIATTTSSTTSVVVVATSTSSTTPVVATTTPSTSTHTIISIKTIKDLNTFIKNTAFTNSTNKNNFTANAKEIINAGEVLNLNFTTTKDSDSIGLYTIPKSSSVKVPVSMYLENHVTTEGKQCARSISMNSRNQANPKTPILNSTHSQGICWLKAFAESALSSLHLGTPAGWPTATTTQTSSKDSSNTRVVFNNLFFERIAKNAGLGGSPRFGKLNQLYSSYTKALTGKPATVTTQVIGGEISPTTGKIDNGYPITSNLQQQIINLMKNGHVDCELFTNGHASHIRSATQAFPPFGDMTLVIDDDTDQGEAPSYSNAPFNGGTTTFRISSIGTITPYSGAGTNPNDNNDNYWVDPDHYSTFIVACYTVSN